MTFLAIKKQLIRIRCHSKENAYIQDDETITLTCMFRINFILQIVFKTLNLIPIA